MASPFLTAQAALRLAGAFFDAAAREEHLVDRMGFFATGTLLLLGLVVPALLADMCIFWPLSLIRGNAQDCGD